MKTTKTFRLNDDTIWNLESIKKREGINYTQAVENALKVYSIMLRIAENEEKYGEIAKTCKILLGKEGE